MKQQRKVALPRYGEYNCALKYMVEQGFEARCILPPPMSRHTEELGARVSPDLVCTPFKTTLGSMMEALEAGADTIIMVYGACRLNYFGELQEQILRDQGYTFEFINLSLYNTGKKRDILRALRVINPRRSMVKAARAFRDAFRMVEYLDDTTAFYYQNCGFDPSGTYPKIYRRFLADLYAAGSLAEIQEAYRAANHAFADVTLQKPPDPVRIGIIGDYFTVMDPFSNLHLEQKLADLGAEVHRLMNITNDMLRNTEKNKQVKILDFSEYSMGASSTTDIWQARNFAERGFDGIIQVKSACCMPETDIMPVLANLSRDYKIPVLYLTYDQQTSDVGLLTRLEAFYDMVEMRKKVAR
jgi:predicted nucleotide-binding protein (sugar kinase/HSP70/actin superfamily)